MQRPERGLRHAEEQRCSLFVLTGSEGRVGLDGQMAFIFQKGPFCLLLLGWTPREVKPITPNRPLYFPALWGQRRVLTESQSMFCFYEG